MGCKKTVVKVTKKVAREVGPILLRKAAETVQDLETLDLQGSLKKDVAVAVLKREAKELGQEVRTHMLGMAVEYAHAAIDRAGADPVDVGADWEAEAPETV